MKKLIITAALGITIITAATAQQAQQGRSIGRGYSKKLLEQEKYFESLKKTNGETYGNKEVSVEIAIGKTVDVNIDNNNRTVEIKPWDEQKVKITTMVYFDGTMSKLSNESWFDKLNINTKLLGNSLRIKTSALGYGSYSNQSSSGGGTSSSSYQESVEIYSVDGQYIRSEPAKKRIVTIYVPKENKLILNNKYADVAITDYIKKLSATVTSGNLDIEKVNTISLCSKYSDVSINEVQQGTIDFINGKLTVGTLGDVELDTKYSNIEIANTHKLNFKSTNDEYELEEVASVEGSKQYGSMKIGKLTESLQMDGINADIRIKNIDAETKNIWIDDKYADLRLPLKNVKSASVSYEGLYSNIYKKFAMKPYDKSGEHRDPTSAGDQVNDDSKMETGSNSNVVYKGSVGDGSNTKIAIKCQNCTVDFK